jgi:hypothetical protein
MGIELRTKPISKGEAFVIPASLFERYSEKGVPGDLCESETSNGS